MSNVKMKLLLYHQLTSFVFSENLCDSIKPLVQYTNDLNNY